MTRRKKPPPIPPVVLGGYKARLARGPRLKDGLIYWRIQFNGISDGCLWATREDIEHELARRLAGVAIPLSVEVPKTLGELVSQWLEIQQVRTDIEPLSIRGFRIAANRLIRDAGMWPLAEIPKRMHTLRTRPLAKSSITQELKVLRRIWRWGEDQGFCSGRLPRVPVAGPDPARHTPTAREALQVEAVLEGELKVAHAIIRVTGCRGVAVQRLTWADIDWDKGALRFCGKGRRVRKVPIPQVLVDILRAFRHRREKPFSRHVLHRLRCHVRARCRRLDIPSYALHGLRRLRVQEYRRAGVPVRVAADLLGHTPQVMLSMYDKATDEDKRAALQAVWEREEPQ